jgi:RNA polymerase sigma-70 factor (ECF subfamily)
MPMNEQPPNEPTDVELMLKLKAGDDGSFVDLVRRHQNSLIRFFHSMGLTADAEDAAQETFLRLHRYRHRYEPKATFRTFIHLLARQVCLDAFRRRQRRERHLDVYKQQAVHEAALPETAGHSGEAPAIAAELLKELPEAMRTVVVMSIYDEMPYDEIAKVLDIPVGTVKSRMFNAMLRMRVSLHARKRTH